MPTGREQIRDVGQASACHPVERRHRLRRGAYAVLLLAIFLSIAGAAHAAPAPRIVDVTTFAGPLPQVTMLRTRTGWLIEATNPTTEPSSCPCLTIAIPRGYVVEISVYQIIAWEPWIAYSNGIEIGRSLPFGQRIARTITISAGPHATNVAFGTGNLTPGQSLLAAQITVRRSR